MNKLNLIKNYFLSNQRYSNSHVSVNNLSPIFEEIESLFKTDECKSNDCTSLYDILNLIYNYNNKLNFVFQNYSSIFTDLLSRVYKESVIYIDDFDFNNKMLKVNFKYNNSLESFFISMNENNKFYIVAGESNHSRYILSSIERYLPKLYSNLYAFKGFKTEHRYVLKSTNSKFKVDINCHSVKLYYRKVSSRQFTDFEIKKDIFKKNYFYSCNLPAIVDITRGREKELFDKIQVRIDDCPDWSKSLLLNKDLTATGLTSSKVKTLVLK